MPEPLKPVIITISGTWAIGDARVCHKEASHKKAQNTPEAQKAKALLIPFVSSEPFL
jgi:hypothetical protein